MLAGELYVTGGLSIHPVGSLSSVEKYTPSRDSWSAMIPLPSRRCQHAAVAVGSAIYVLGGSTRRGFGGSTLASVLKIDSTQGTWSVVEPMPEPRRGHSECAIGSDIYIFGGRCDVGRTTSSVFKYDTAANT
jgi:N-acetylneuraminic acid mutarotase